MPIYEYRCPNGHVDEKLETITSDKTEDVCSECGEKSEKIVSGAICHMAGMVGGCVKNW